MYSTINTAEHKPLPKKNLVSLQYFGLLYKRGVCERLVPVARLQFDLSACRSLNPLDL